MKILIAGLGGIGQRHARNLRAILGDSVELIAWRVRRLSRVITPALEADETHHVEAEYKIRTFDRLPEALAEKPDAAFVCNPTSLHVETAQACAEAGCHLFIEKPVSNNLHGVQELLETVKARELVGLVGYQLRFHPCLRALRELLAAKAVGRVLAVRAVIGEYLPGWHAYEDYRQMYASSAALGGGVILSQIHEFDYLYSLFGMPHSVYSVGGHWSSLDIDVEDTASTLMSFTVDDKPVAVHLHQDYLQRPACRQCEIIGDEGKIVADFAGLRVTSPQGTQNFTGFERNQLFLDQSKHFLACIAGHELPVVDLKAGIQSLRMALAAKESIASGKPVVFEIMSHPSFDLSGKIAVITGGAGLLGEQHARAIIAAKGIPVLLDVAGVRVADLAAKLSDELRLNVSGFPADITKPNEVKRVLAEVLGRYGRIDILINNAAANPKVEGAEPANFSRFESFSLDKWNAELAVGITGAFICCQVFGTEMARRGAGVILNVSSDLGLIAPDQRIYRLPNLPDNLQPVKPVTYSVTKSALIGLTRYLATYWAHRGVRVNAICPGGVTNGQPDEFVTRLTNLVPMGRMARVDEYQGAIVFLCSDAASYMTGAVLAIDGGRTSW